MNVVRVSNRVSFLGLFPGLLCILSNMHFRQGKGSVFVCEVWDGFQLDVRCEH